MERHFDTELRHGHVWTERTRVESVESPKLLLKPLSERFFDRALVVTRVDQGAELGHFVGAESLVVE